MSGQPGICRIHLGSYSGVAGDFSLLECDAVLISSQFPMVQIAESTESSAAQRGWGGPLLGTLKYV